MNITHARESLTYTDKAAHRARRDVGLSWLPVLLYAAFAVVAIAAPGVTSQGQFLWLVAAPVVTGFAFLYARREERASGIEGRPLAWVAIPFVVLALAFAVGALAFFAAAPDIARYLPPIILAAGYAGFAWFERSLLIAGVSAAVLVGTVGMVAFGRAEMSQAVLALVFVLTLLAIRVRTLLAARLKRRSASSHE